MEVGMTEDGQTTRQYDVTRDPFIRRDISRRVSLKLIIPDYTSQHNKDIKLRIYVTRIYNEECCSEIVRCQLFVFFNAKAKDNISANLNCNLYFALKPSNISLLVLSEQDRNSFKTWAVSKPSLWNMGMRWPRLALFRNDATSVVSQDERMCMCESLSHRLEDVWYGFTGCVLDIVSGSW